VNTRAPASSPRPRRITRHRAACASARTTRAEGKRAGCIFLFIGRGRRAQFLCQRSPFDNKPQSSTQCRQSHPRAASRPDQGDYRSRLINRTRSCSRGTQFSRFAATATRSGAEALEQPTRLDAPHAPEGGRDVADHRACRCALDAFNHRLHTLARCDDDAHRRSPSILPPEHEASDSDARRTAMAGSEDAETSLPGLIVLSATGKKEAKLRREANSTGAERAHCRDDFIPRGVQCRISEARDPSSCTCQPRRKALDARPPA